MMKKPDSAKPYGRKDNDKGGRKKIGGAHYHRRRAPRAQEDGGDVCHGTFSTFLVHHGRGHLPPTCTTPSSIGEPSGSAS